MLTLRSMHARPSSEPLADLLVPFAKIPGGRFEAESVRACGKAFDFWAGAFWAGGHNGCRDPRRRPFLWLIRDIKNCSRDDVEGEIHQETAKR